MIRIIPSINLVKLVLPILAILEIRCLIFWHVLYMLTRLVGELGLNSILHKNFLSCQERSGSTVPSILNRVKSDEKRPTYHKVNKFTRGFQAIVDAYGMATYEEVNPGMLLVLTLHQIFEVTKR